MGSEIHDRELTINTNQTVLEVKGAYAELEGKAVEQIRLFYGGRLLKDDDNVAS
jgi:hypothetical protein